MRNASQLFLVSLLLVFSGCQMEPPRGGAANLFEAIEQDDPAAMRKVLTQTFAKDPSSSSFIAFMNQKNDRGQTPLELCVQRRSHKMATELAAFAQSKGILPEVFFEPIEMTASLHLIADLEFLVGIFSAEDYGLKASALLVRHNVADPRAPILLAAFGPHMIDVFALGYYQTLADDPATASQFLRLASSFRLEKRKALIDALMALNDLELFDSRRERILAVAGSLGLARALWDAPSEHAPGDGNTQLPRDAQADAKEALMLAIENNDPDRVRAWVKSGARVDSVNQNGQTPFHIAAATNHGAALQALLDTVSCQGESPLRHKDAHNQTPFQLACEHEGTNQSALLALTDFYLSHKECDRLLESGVHALIATKNTPALARSIVAISDKARGADFLAQLFFRQSADRRLFLAEVMRDALHDETFHSILSKSLYMALRALKTEFIDSMMPQIDALSVAQKQQLIGYMLFIDSGSAQSPHHQAILDLASRFGLESTQFEGVSSHATAIKEALDTVVIGQEQAKVSLSVAVTNHYKRLAQGMKKSNILILGPSGTGKTLMVENAAKALGVPFVVADSSNITQAGYVGGKVGDAVAALAAKAEYEIDQIEKGIIFFDEIDKMAGRANDSKTDEFKRQGQATLLKLIEGMEVEVPVGSHNKMTVDTSKILFVCAGAFTGLADIIESRLKREGKLMSDNLFAQVSTEDFVAYGLQPELLGRLPNVVALHALGVDDLVKILRTPKASILEEYRMLFKGENIELIFSDDAIAAMAEEAAQYKVGARALRTVVERVMADLHFRLSRMGAIQTCTITGRVVKNGDMPLLIYRS